MKPLKQFIGQSDAAGVAYDGVSVAVGADCRVVPVGIAFYFRRLEEGPAGDAIAELRDFDLLTVVDGVPVCVLQFLLRVL